MNSCTFPKIMAVILLCSSMTTHIYSSQIICLGKKERDYNPCNHVIASVMSGGCEWVYTKYQGRYEQCKNDLYIDEKLAYLCKLDHYCDPQSSSN